MNDRNFNAVSHTETVEAKGGKKGKKGKMTIVCESNLTQEQMNEYPTIEKEPEPVPEKKEKKKKGKQETHGDGDMADFNFYDPQPAFEEDKDDIPVYLLEEAPKKVDDSRLVQRGPGKKKNKKNNWVAYNPHQLPSGQVDYNKLFK